MGVQVLSPESHHAKPLRALPKLPKLSQYSLKPLNNVKPSRALPTVPNSNVSKLDTTVKLTRALPRAPKQSDNKKSIAPAHARHGRTLPEVPYRDVKDVNTSNSSRTSTPKLILSHTNNNNSNNKTSHHHHHRHSNVLNVHNNTQSHVHGTTTTTQQQHHAYHHHHHHGKDNQHLKENNQSTKEHSHGNRVLPKIPKALLKSKPEPNRIEYMNEAYRKEGDLHADDGNYEQALKSYNLETEKERIMTVRPHTRIKQFVRL